MSDFSGLEQSFAIPALAPLDAADELGRYDLPPVSNDVQPHEIGFRRLRGSREIARVMHLRQQIALPVSAVSDPGFRTREKKETKLA